MLKKRKLIILTAVILLITLSLLVIPNFNFSEQTLSDDEIEELRVSKNYKIYEAYYNPLMSYEVISMRKHIERSDTFIYCEVVSNLYRVPIIMSEEDKEKDPDDLPKLIMYDIKVISDSEGLYEKGTITNFAYGRANQTNAPRPKVGEKIIIPITLGEKNSTAQNYSGCRGYYYITEDGFGIAAFKEDEEYTYSGKTAENILAALKKTDEERKAYLSEKIESYEKTNGEYGFNSIDMLRKQIKERLSSKKES